MLYGHEVAALAGVLDGPDPKCERDFQRSAGTCFQDLGNASKIVQSNLPPASSGTVTAFRGERLVTVRQAEPTWHGRLIPHPRYVV